MQDCPPTQAEALQAQVAQLKDELQQARETNRRLNRRNQNLERQVAREPSQLAWKRVRQDREHYRARAQEAWKRARLAEQDVFVLTELGKFPAEVIEKAKTWPGFASRIRMHGQIEMLIEENKRLKAAETHKTEQTP